MIESDKPRFQDAFSACWEILKGGKEVASAPLIRGYFMALSDLPIEAVEKAFAIANRINTFFPKPGELRKLLIYTFIDPDSLAESAWQVVKLRAVDTGRQLWFEDPVIKLAIRESGGIEHYYRTTNGELERFTKPRFLKAYKRWLEAGELPNSASKPFPVIGRGESWQHNNEVVRIGCDYRSQMPRIEMEPDSEAVALIESVAKKVAR